MMIGWKECPENAIFGRKYVLDKENPRFAIKYGYGHDFCTIIGNAPLPPSRTSSWNINVLKLLKNEARSFFVGVAPSDINQNEDNNYEKCGWYLDCYKLELFSGHPHDYRYKNYGPGIEWGGGKYFHTGDSVGVVMDTTSGELSFYLNKINYGIAFERIPLDKPLVPCVILKNDGDSVELDLTMVKEVEPTKTLQAPYNIRTESTAFDSITLAWDPVEGASFYQVVAEGRKDIGSTRKTSFRMDRLKSVTEYRLRVRTVAGDSVSEWSKPVNEFTQKSRFGECVWKEYSGDYGVAPYVNSRNPRVVTARFRRKYAITGTMPIPLNDTTLWSIKILKSRKNDGEEIFVGVAPFDIDQSNENNYKKCGWYFNCFFSELYSGPPHNKFYYPYGPRREKGQYVHRESVIEVKMNPEHGELSFSVDCVNHGVAYEGIPLDKPLVPCVILGKQGDSVELILDGNENGTSNGSRTHEGGIGGFLGSIKSHLF